MSWLKFLLDALAGEASRMRAEEVAGPLEDFAHVTVPLGSGYSVADERQERAGRLRAACEQVVSDPSLVSVGGVTHCNAAAERIAFAMGCADLRGLMANQQLQRMASGGGWKEELGFEKLARAALHAGRGGLAFCAVQEEPHGHLAAVFPASMQPSGTWGEEVPVIANVGLHNGIMRLSEGFFLRHRTMMRVFLWGDV